MLRAAWPHILSADAMAQLAPPPRWDPAGGARTIVAEVDGAIVGFVLTRPSADEDATPEMGEVLTLGQPRENRRWWKDLR